MGYHCFGSGLREMYHINERGADERGANERERSSLQGGHKIENLIVEMERDCI